MPQKVQKTILITNDDGIEAPGLAALYEGIRELGRIYCIAPATDQSATSHAFSLRRPMAVRQLRPNWYSVAGTPTDCVLISHHALLSGKIDLVVSGINNGPNLGDDVLYSGTVAAAIEGTLLGIPSVAISEEFGVRQAGIEPANHQAAMRFIRSLIQYLLRRRLPKKTLLNVNIPAGEIRGWKVTRLGKRIYRDIAIESRAPNGDLTYLLDGEMDYEIHRGSDFEAVHQGKISITPLDIDMTHYREIRRFRREIQRYFSSALDL